MHLCQQRLQVSLVVKQTSHTSSVHSSLSLPRDRIIIHTLRWSHPFCSVKKYQSRPSTPEEKRSIRITIRRTRTATEAINRSETTHERLNNCSSSDFLQTQSMLSRLTPLPELTVPLLPNTRINTMTPYASFSVVSPPFSILCILALPLLQTT